MIWNFLWIIVKYDLYLVVNKFQFERSRTQDNCVAWNARRQIAFATSRSCYSLLQATIFTSTEISWWELSVDVSSFWIELRIVTKCAKTNFCNFTNRDEIQHNFCYTSSTKIALYHDVADNISYILIYEKVISCFRSIEIECKAFRPCCGCCCCHGVLRSAPTTVRT